jgi:hypothetical protein
MMESLEKMIDRARQRHFTDEEITRIAHSAGRMAQGCDVAEAIAASEGDLVNRAVTATLGRFPAVEGRSPNARPLAVELLQQSLRQAALAMALDDGDRYFTTLAEYQSVVWNAGLEPAFVESLFEELRDVVRARIGNKLYDAWLKIAARFFTANAAVGASCHAIINEVAAQVISEFPELANRFPDCEAKIRADLEKYLSHTALGLLDDGHHRVFRMLHTYHQAAARSRYGAAPVQAACDLLSDACRRHLAAGPTVEFLAELKRVTHFLVLSADLIDKRDAILNSVVETLYALHPDKANANGRSDVREMTKRDLWLVLEHVAFGTHPGGQQKMLDVMAEFNLTLFRFNFGARLIIDAYQLLLEACRRELSGGSLAVLEPHLHRACHYVAMSADLAEKQEPMLNSLAEELAARYPDYYNRHPTSKVYVTRDQEQVLHNIALGLLAGSHHLTVGRFSVFGEYLVHARFNEKMMLESFEMLEQACLTNLSGQSLARLIPRMRRVRQYLELCSMLAFKEEEIVKEVSEAVFNRYATEIDRFSSGREKVKRDLETMLHTAAIAFIPDGEKVLVRGLENFYENLLRSRMNKEMIELTYRSLAKATAARFPSHKNTYIPVLDSCATFLHVACDVAEHQDSIVAAAVEAAFAKYPEMTTRYAGARRRAEEDLELVVRRCALALVPGGEEPLASGMWRFLDSIMASRFDPEFLKLAYGELRKGVSKKLDRVSNNSLGAVMDKVIAAIDLFAELSQKEGTIVGEAVAALFSKHPRVAEMYSRARHKTTHDMAMVLRHGALLAVPGSEARFASLMRTLAAVTIKARFGDAFMQDAYQILLDGVNKHLSRAHRKLVGQAVEAARDYLTLVAGLGDQEEQILADSLDKLFRDRGRDLSSYPQAREHVRHDEQMILRSSALALVPGGEREHEELLSLMGVVCARGQFDRSLLLDAYKALGDSCTSHLKLGPVKQLVGAINKSAQTFARLN